MNSNSSRQDPIVSDETRHLLADGEMNRSHRDASERWPQQHWPREIGNNVIVGKLGEGGAAIVFDAINKETGAKRALKILFPDSSPENRRRFEREIALSSQLQHSNTIGAIECGEWEGLPFLTMKKIEGRSLTTLIRDTGKLPAAVVAALGHSAAGTLSYCHSLSFTLFGERQTGILHRDIKPSNLMIGNDGELYIADFSIATPVFLDEKEENPHGSMPYFAPEIIEKSAVDHRSDIFSLGCTLYEALCGSRAFDAADIDSLMQKRKKNQFEDLKSRAPQAPARLVDLISRCMAFDPVDRPESMEEVERECASILKKLTNQPVDSVLETYIKGDSAVKDSHHSFGWLWVGFCVLLVAAVVFGFTYPPAFEKIQRVLPWEDAKRLLAMIPFSGGSDEDIAMVVPDGPDDGDTQKGRSKKQLREQPPQKHITFTPHRKKRGTSSASSRRKPKSEPRSYIPRHSELPQPSRDTQPQKQMQTMETVAAAPQEDTEQPPEELTLTQQLMEKHESSDLLEVLKREADAQHYENVLIILEEFPVKQRNSPLAQVYRIRALDATNRLIQSDFESVDADDGEIHFLKGKFLYKKGNYEKAIDQADIARRSPVMLLGRQELVKRASLLEARARSGLFRSLPAEKTRKAAMESWVSVKSAYRDQPSSPVVAEANQAIRELIKAENQLNTVEQ